MSFRWSWRPASPATVTRLRTAAGAWPLSYPQVGATRSIPPRGYRLDITEVTLGHGQTVFAHARSLLRAWTPFAQPWLALFGAETPPTPGQVVVLHARHFGLQSLNVCRVVYVHDEPRGFAFAYGTLALHAARGEERFAVRWHDDDRVSFRITAFSRPNGALIWLGYPVMRVLQRRFARTAGQIMRAAVQNRA